MANLNLNKVILGGRLTAEPELKSTPSGTPVLSFHNSLHQEIRSEGRKRRSGTAERFHKLRRMASDSGIHSAVFPHKGSGICVVGRIQTRSYTDTAGNKRHITGVVVDETCFVDSKSDRKTESDIVTQAPQFEVIGDEEELPF